MGVDLKDARGRINDCIRLGERMSPHFAMDLLEHIEGLEAHVALLKASLKQATKAEERVRALEEALGEVRSGMVCGCKLRKLIGGAVPCQTCRIDRALSTERMPE